LAGARIIELKTVQVNDRLQLSRPCIDMATVGYNTEWSQELTLDQSLREYVKASMLIEMLDASRMLETAGDGVVFDISVGYDLAGIRSAAIGHWLASIRNAHTLVEELRSEIPAEFRSLRDMPFRTAISASVTLSTFHGTPAAEIERICEFLIGELGLHTVVKLNPPMLGRRRVEHILHDTLGYHDIEVNPACYDRNLPFDEAVGMVRRLQSLALRHGVGVGVKCGNTLEVTNKGTFLKERVQYLSGQPLHALHVALVQQWREEFGADLQISFSAGVDAHNVADCVAAGLVPVTTCTDLLRTRGYARLPKYLYNLESRMRELGATTIPEFIAASSAAGTSDALAFGAPSRPRRTEPSDGEGGTPADVSTNALRRNTDSLLSKALTDERYRADRNRKSPRKVGSHLAFWDCLDCDKCIPVCPNDANFEIEVAPFDDDVGVIEVAPTGWREVARRRYTVRKRIQIANFADACNDCGNCDVFCPEDGGPYIEKPRFFGSLEAWHRAAPLAGFVLADDGRGGAGIVLHGRFPGGIFALRADADAVANVDLFSTGPVVMRVDRQTCGVLAAVFAPSVTRDGVDGRGADSIRIDLSYYVAMRTLLDALKRPERINFVNTAFVGMTS
jgi:putative selenate reductase